MTKGKCKLYDWLRENRMTIKEFSDHIGCCRVIPLKVQNGKPVCKEIALAISIFTKGLVKPTVKNVGRPRLMNKSTIINK